MKVLTIDEIAHVNDVRYEEVPTPEWGEGTSVRIASLSAEEMLSWLDLNRDPSPRGNRAGLTLITKAIVDADGNHIGKPEHVDILAKRDAQCTGRIVNAILRMNGMSPITKGVEDAKNGLSGVATTTSPTTLH